MKPLLLSCLLACLIYLQSCGDGTIKNKDAGTGKTGHTSRLKIPVPAATDNLIIGDEKDIVGYWVGNCYSAFQGNVNISIDEINGDKVVGHSLVAGIYKPFVSQLEKEGDTFHFFANRTGNGKYDGKFKLAISKGDSILQCTWMPYGSVETNESAHGFSKRSFRYAPNNKLDLNYRFVDYKKERSVIYHDVDGDVPAAAYFAATPEVNKYNTSTDLLTKDDVANMKKPDIIVLRNSIFARHGYAFKKEALWAYFSNMDWYIPVSTDVTADLNEIEKKNIEMLMRYEKNAKDYYYTFAR